ncbi:regulatory protein Ral2 [Pseudohyphozyma bogoriensis]|nr:regulatory protein Ral2 [Pseudohyphozyma bogoriensis]
MVSTLYRLSLVTLTWTRLWPPPSSTFTDSTDPSPPPTATPSSEPSLHPPNEHPGGPVPRYFHSAEAWGNKIVIFGGEGYAPLQDGETIDQVPLITLGDVIVWDTVEGKWEFPEVGCEEGVERPEPRYAHLGVVSSFVEEGKGVLASEEESRWRERSLLIILGGQDIKNTYLHTVNVLDLETMMWVRVGKWDRHIGTYRAVATTAKWTVVPGGPSPTPVLGSTSAKGAHRSSKPVTPSPLGGGAGGKEELEEGNGMGLKKGETLTQLSYSTRAPASKAEPLLIFSNFNFTQVRRDLDMLSAPSPPTHPLDTTSLSTMMAGIQLPPGLRFPTGTIVGRHLLIFGTYLSHTVNTFSIWALDLGPAGAGGIPDLVKRGDTLNWMKVDPGSALAKGSWNRALGWKNSVVVIGDRERDIASDYDHRQTNFTHLTFVDLEAFGIYQPPPQPLPPLAQSFGLLTLSQPFLADFEIICSDGKRLGCSRKMLEDRWPWFKERMDDFKSRAKGILAASKRVVEPSTAGESENGHSTSPTVAEKDDTTSTFPGNMKSPTRSSTELRLTPRTLNLPEPSSVVQGFLQYLYTLTLCTPLQLTLPVLSGLLVFAKTYNEANLRALVVHALHEAVTTETWSAAAVYEAATLGGCTALQIRTLRLMLAGPRAVAKKNGNDSAEGSVQTVGYFDKIPELFSDTEGESEFEDVCGTPGSVSTLATSVSSRASSTGNSRPGSGEGKEQLARAPELEPQLEVDEPASPTDTVNLSRIASRPITPFMYLPTSRAPSPPPSTIVSEKETVRRSFSISSRSTRARTLKRPKPPKRVGSDSEWRPSGISLLDTQRVADAVPLSTRVATEISEEMMAKFDNLLLPTSIASMSLVDLPKSALNPTLQTEAITMSGSTTSASELSTSGGGVQELSRASADSERPTVSSSSSKRSSGGYFRDTASSFRRYSTNSSTRGDPFPYDVEDAEGSPSPLKSLVNSLRPVSLRPTRPPPPLPLAEVTSAPITVDSTPARHPHVSSPSAPVGVSLIGIPEAGPRLSITSAHSQLSEESSGSSAHDRRWQLAALGLPVPASASLGPPSASSRGKLSSGSSIATGRAGGKGKGLRLFSSQAPSAHAKTQRRELETTLGAQVLRASGASEAEITLRSRSVGYGLLKKQEEAMREKEGTGKKGSRHGAAQTAKSLPAHGGEDGVEYRGGAVLASAWSNYDD